MKRKWPLAVLGLVLLAGGGGIAWWKLRPAPPAAPDERTFEDIPKDEYEQWMQDLGYTE